MPTLRELNVKPGDVVVSNKNHFNVGRLGDFHVFMKPIRAREKTPESIWSLDGINDWQIVSRASGKTPKPWGEMTDEEKTPILLAWARGEKIECQDESGKWRAEYHGPRVWGDLPHRIKPKRVEAIVHWGLDGVWECSNLKNSRRRVINLGGHVYRLTRNEDGSDPQIEKVEV